MTEDFLHKCFVSNWNEAIEKAADVAPDTYTKEQILKLKKSLREEAKAA